MNDDDTAKKSTKPAFKLPLGGLSTSKDKPDVGGLLQKNSGRRHAGESYTPSNISSKQGNTFTPSAAGAKASKYGRAAGAAGANQTPLSSMMSDSCLTSDISTPMDADQIKSQFKNRMG